MVDKFKTILRKIEQDKGPVTLLVLLKMDEFTDKWSLIITAPWADNSREVFNYLFKVLTDNLTLEEGMSIARIGIFPKNEHIVELFLSYQSDTKITEDTQLNGNIIHEAYIIKSDNRLAKQHDK